MGNELLDRISAMRDATPIFRSELNGGLWMVTGHREVVEGFAGKVPLSAKRLPDMVVGGIPENERMEKIPYFMTTTAHWLVNMDRPAQSRLRNLAQKAFSSKVAESLRPRVRAAVKAALDEAEGKERIELVSDVALRVTGATILYLLDLPDDIFPRLRQWSIEINAVTTTVNMPAEVMMGGERVLLEMRDVFLPEIEKARRNPNDGFISSLVSARDADGDTLDEEEILGILYIALIAGHDTSTNTMALGTAALAGLPDVRAYMRANPEQIGDVVMEIGRYVAMSTLQGRVAAEDFEWHGHQIKRGEVVLLLIAAANRDPSVFENPDVFDPARPQDKNMTFAPGLHFCIGHFLAKMQLQEYFSQLIERFDPVVLDDHLNFGMALGFRGLDTLDVRLDKRS
jgi:cytochrome P450